MKLPDFFKNKDKIIDELKKFPTQEDQEEITVKSSKIDFRHLGYDESRYDYIDLVKEFKKQFETATQQKHEEMHQQLFTDAYLREERFYAVLGSFTFEDFCDHIDALMYHANEFNEGRVLDIEYDGIRMTQVLEKDDICMNLTVVRNVHAFIPLKYSGSGNVISRQVSTSFDVVEGEDGKCDLMMFMTNEYSLDDLVYIMKTIIETARNNVEGYW